MPLIVFIQMQHEINDEMYVHITPLNAFYKWKFENLENFMIQVLMEKSMADNIHILCVHPTRTF